MYQYLKFGWIVALLMLAAVQNRALQYISWAFLFAYLLVDDALQIHERLGVIVASRLDFTPMFNLRLVDFGELAVTAMATMTLLPLLAWAYRSGSAAFRKTSRDIGRLILVLVFFGVVVDMLHIAVVSGPHVQFLLGVLEDGGEMLAVTVVLLYTFLLTVRGDDNAFHLRDFLPRPASRWPVVTC